MTEKSIRLGNGQGGKPFTLPIDALIQTFAWIGIRGSGKTCGGTDMAEEFCKAGHPWIALDPTGVWWGLRANRDGSPGGFESVVVIGGKHGDLPIDKNGGRKLARAIVEANICAVIDLSGESKNTIRMFVTDFCEELLQIETEGYHIFLEEGHVLIPQKPKGKVMLAAHAAVEKLVTQGRNQGYGCSVLNQRAATVDKDVLSQCENVFAFRSTHNLDRKAFKDWLEGKVMDEKLWKKFLGELAGLKDGECFFWSPSWLERFVRLRTRIRETYHPGATRKVGVKLQTVSLSDARAFVDRLKRQLTKKTPEHDTPLPSRGGAARDFPGKPSPLSEDAPPTPRAPGGRAPRALGGDGNHDFEANALQNLREKLHQERTARQQAEGRVEAVRRLMKPQYDALQKLFGALGTGTEGGADRAAYEPWLQRAGDGKRKAMLEVLLDRREVTRSQLATLAVVSIRSSTFRNNMSWLKRNNLAEIEGQNVKLIGV